MLIKEDDPRLKWYRQGKNPKGIQAACDYINNYNDFVDKIPPPDLYYNKWPTSIQEKMRSNWFPYFGKKHGVSGVTVRNRVKGIMRILNISFEDIRKTEDA